MRKLVTILILPFLGIVHLSAQTKVDFMTEVKPIIEATCIGCHGAKDDKGGYRMHTKAEAFAEDFYIVPGNAEDSDVYILTTLGEEDDDVMPPKKSGVLTLSQQETLKNWINQGAEWPEDLVLEQKPRIKFESNVLPILRKGGEFSAKDRATLRNWVHQGAVWPEGFSIGAAEEESGLADNLDLVIRMREEIVANSPESKFDEMKEYENSIPKAGGAKYQMVPIPGGEFLMGSPDDETDRFDDEGPQHKVKVEPFWMGKYEVTWDMYNPFMITEVPREKNGAPKKIEPNAAMEDIVSAPTTPYVEMSFGMGTDGYPAIAMTQHAANKFCQWLSAQTGHFYRLPTEAEWEYACRAGTTGAFHCDESELADYAVYDPTQVRTGYAKVGTKKPNPWGLYDMHGNVMEWCLDQYIEDSYQERAGGNVVLSPLVKPTKLYPRIARGGSWYDPALELRSARRVGSDKAWKVQDPQLPKSIWYHTDATWLGFRIVRPLKVPSAQKMEEYWNLGVIDEE